MAINPKKHEMPSQEPLVRAHNFNEVALGYTPEIAVEEANRCLNCKNRPCVQGCPVNIAIPEASAVSASAQRAPRRALTIVSPLSTPAARAS